MDPGPGEYAPDASLQYEVKNGNSSVLSTRDVILKKEAKESRFNSLLKKGPAHYRVGDILVNAAQVHIPVFGTQTDRFVNNANSGILLIKVDYF